MITCPIDYFTDNLIFGSDKSCWALFELQGFDYDLLSDESKIQVLNRLVLFISRIETEAKIICVPVAQDLDRHFKALIDFLCREDPLYPAAVSQAQATCKFLKKSVEVNGRCNDYKTFVIFKLQRSEEEEVVTMAKDALRFLVSSIINDFDAFMHLDTKDISTAKIKEYQKHVQQIYDDQRKRVALHPTDGHTTQWLLRRMFYRGLPDEFTRFCRTRSTAWHPSSSTVELAGAEYLRPRSRELVNLFDGAIYRKGRHLEIQHDRGTSYQTFLQITNIPEDLSFPDCEWIYLIQQFNKQAEIYIHIKSLEHREAIRKIDLQRRAADSQVDNIYKAHAEIPDDLVESKEAIDALEAELKVTKSPLVQASITVCLAADTLDELEKKSDYVRKEYEDLNFVVERPLTDQFDLFMQCVPSVSFCVSDFILRMTPLSLAAGIFGATHALGDEIGYYIGTTGVEKKMVFLNLRLACLANISASTVFYGNLGVGKSFNANLLLYLHVLYGAYGLIVDPKGERTHWLTDLKALSGLISIVTLSPDRSFAGMLDPFNIFRDNVDEACELAQNVLAELFKIQPKDLGYTALLEAIHEIKREPQPSMVRLSEILDGFPQEDTLCAPAQLLARQIRLLRDSGMAQLLIGDGTEDAIRLDNRLNILQIQNLKLPSPDAKKEDYTSEETTSSVLMMVIAAFSRKFLHSHPNQFKILLFDESWMLGKTAEGEKLISYASRMSRSLYAAIVLNGHSVTDLPNEGIKNAITYKFCFRTGNVDEAGRMLDFLNLEKTPSNIDLIMGLGNAQCLFQDRQGHVGVLKFDAVFSDLIEVFSTTPVDATIPQAGKDHP